MVSEKKLTKREQRLLGLLPAALILMVYSFLIALPKQRRLEVMMVELTNTQASSVNEQATENTLKHLQSTKASFTQLSEQMEIDRGKIQQLSQSWRSPDARLDTIREITEIMGNFNLSIVSQDYAIEPEIPEYFLRLTKSINQQSPDAPPIEYWKIELEGSYADVQAFLMSIDIGRMKTFPLTFSLVASNANDGLHKWTILFAV